MYKEKKLGEGLLARQAQKTPGVASKKGATMDKIFKKKQVEQKKDNSDVFKGQLTGLDQFGEHKDLFESLTKRCFIDTKKLDVVQCIITYDSKNCVAILANNHEREYSLFELHQYSLKTH